MTQSSLGATAPPEAKNELARKRGSSKAKALTNIGLPNVGRMLRETTAGRRFAEAFCAAKNSRET